MHISDHRSKVFAQIILGITIAVGVVWFLVYDGILHGPGHHRAQLRIQCRNNLKQIGLALHNYHDAYNSYPPAYVADEHGRPMHSWRVLLLPFLDEEKLYKEYRFDEPWNGPHNITLQDRIPHIYSCPGYQFELRKSKIASDYSRRLTNYVVIDDPTAIFDGEKGSTNDEITDGTSNTIAVVEVHQHAVHWMQPEDITPDEMMLEFIASRDEERTNHRDGMQVLLADGSARKLEPDLSREILKALLTKAGGEKVPEF